ncbi:transporter substrate-binding domain-containing protein [Rheinheimera sp. F8]|uniref:transporter substrate-binding domain-containing protein n=1 Tax=Rheinheimera sp. F8 TaxID=1763998 RepID=UPI000744A18B|nr:transporter substrate-binding domain-containing protein [Rheinheimera sp. F8]ALZ74926.1 hypothetical protein ATY27_03560 [Rheinheimera sp. F8]
MSKLLLSGLFTTSLLATATECPPQLRTFHLFERQSTTPTCVDQWQQAFFNNLGCPLSFVEGNPGTAVREQKLRSGEIELVTGLAQTAQRTFQFSKPIGRNNIYLYRLKSAPQWDNIGDWCDAVMQQARILVPAQGYFGEPLEKLRQYPNCSKWLIPYSHTTVQPFDLLDKGRTDLLVSAERHFAALPAERRAKYQQLRLVVVEGEVHIAFAAHVAPAFIKQVNQQIDKGLQNPATFHPKGKSCLLPPQSTTTAVH